MKDWWALIRKEFDDEEEDFLPEDIDEIEPRKDMDYLTMTDKTLKDRWYGILEQLSTTDFQPMVQGGRLQRRKGKGLIMSAKTFAADMMDSVADIRTKNTGETEQMSSEELDEEKGFTMNEVTQIVNISLGSPLSNVMDTLNSRVDQIEEQDLQELEEVVVVGYGTVRKSDLTGAVSSVELSENEAREFATVDQILQGRAAGVQVTQNSGSPGSGISVRIRGTNSLRGNNEPLYVVDGVIISSAGEDVNPAGGIGNSGQEVQNGLNGLNPRDIESIEVALGPSTALYGANAHSGVVNITSKAPSESEGFDVSVSGTINDDLDLYKISSRWASKINNKLSFKLSNEYLQAYEWPFISEQEYKLHTYPYSGNPIRTSDGKDNNPWGATGLGQGVTESQYQNAIVPGQSVNTMVGYYINEHPGADGVLNTEDDILFTFSTEEECFDAPGYTCTPVSKIIGDGEANNTGDPDGDGFACDWDPEIYRKLSIPND